MLTNDEITFVMGPQFLHHSLLHILAGVTPCEAQSEQMTSWDRVARFGNNHLQLLAGALSFNLVASTSHLHGRLE